MVLLLELAIPSFYEVHQQMDFVNKLLILLAGSAKTSNTFSIFKVVKEAREKRTTIKLDKIVCVRELYYKFITQFHNGYLDESSEKVNRARCAIELPSIT